MKDRARKSGCTIFSVGALVQQINHSPFKHAAQITWLSTDPVWVDQWPLAGEKLAAATALGRNKGRAY
jgi:hypothetical protein